MVDASDRYTVQQPNRIVDIETFFRMTQALEQLEKQINSLSRNLTANEVKLKQTLPGMIAAFKKTEKEFKSSGAKDLNKRQAQELKVFLSGDDKASSTSILRWLNQLSKQNTAGLSKNGRDDKSYIQYAETFEKILDIMKSSMEREYKEMAGYRKTIARAKGTTIGLISSPSIVTPAPPTPVSTGTGRPTRFPNPLDGRSPTTWRDQSALLLYKKYTTPQAKPSASATIYITNIPDEYLKKMHEAWEKYWSDAATKWGESSSIFEHFFKEFMNSNFFNNMHIAFGGLPGVGKVTGASARVAKGYTAGAQAGDALAKAAPRIFPKKIFGGAGLKIAGLAKFLGPAGAIASGIALIYNQLKKSSPVLQAVSNLFELAWNLLWMPLGNALGTLLLPMAEDLINFAIAFNELFTDFSMEKLGEVMYDALQFIWGAIFDLSNAIPTAIINGTLDMLSNLFRSLGWDGVADAIDDFKDKMDDVKEFIRNLPMNLWEHVKGFWQGVFDFFKDPVGKLSSAFEKLGTFIVEGFSKITSGASDWLDSLNPHWFATGGIVTGPTLGIVGEAGPEAVVPLDRANGIGTTYVININGDVYGVQDLESRIERAIQRTANKAYYR